ncbi:MAG: GGDEF domain-containing protein [Caldisericia bacterium]|nr:GGDEF domain-containing protein [Caldisericia bacterium]
MNKNNKIYYQYLIPIIFLIIFWFIARINYLLFHSIIELFAILTAFCIAFLSYSTYRYLKNDFILNLGILYGFVIIVDILHTLAYKGMGVFKTYNANLPTQLWILGRTIEALGLSSIVIFNKKLKAFYNFIFLSIFTATSLILIFLRKFPVCFIEGSGLTPFKISMEYIIVILLTVVLIYIVLKRNIPENFIKAYIYTIIFTILGELSFTLYTDVYGFFNMLGHLFRFISYLIILVGINSKFLIFTIENLTKELNLEKEKYRNLAHYDQLTGVLSRNYFNELIEQKIKNKIINNKKDLVIMIDIDNFKNINDQYGHLHGDEVLRFFGKKLKETFRANDIIVRYGGDEFLIILNNCSFENGELAVERLKQNISINNFNHPLSFSYSINYLDYENLIESLKYVDKKLIDIKLKKLK